MNVRFRPLRTALAAALVVAAPLAAVAQSAPVTANAQAGTTGSSTTTAIVTPRVAAPAVNAQDPLARVFTDPQYIANCRALPVVGPLATPAPGSAAAQPLYQWLQDNRSPACQMRIF